MNWFYAQDTAIIKEYLDSSDFPENVVGIVYIIKNKINNKFYIGKKNLTSTRKKKLGKKEIALQTGRGRKALSKKVTTESDWLSYWGSCKELLKDVKELGQHNFTRQILHFATNKKQLTYLELEEQIKHNVLRRDDTYNSNILGSFFSKDLEE